MTPAIQVAARHSFERHQRDSLESPHSEVGPNAVLGTLVQSPCPRDFLCQKRHKKHIKNQKELLCFVAKCSGYVSA